MYEGKAYEQKVTVMTVAFRDHWYTCVYKFLVTSRWGGNYTHEIDMSEVFPSKTGFTEFLMIALPGYIPLKPKTTAELIAEREKRLEVSNQGRIRCRTVTANENHTFTAWVIIPL